MTPSNPHRQRRIARGRAPGDAAAPHELPQQSASAADAARRHRPAHHLVDSAILSVAKAQTSTRPLSFPAAEALPNDPLSLTADEQQRFHALYNEHFNFVFRNLRRLGVPGGSTDDALQEVFLVVLRRLRDLQHGTHTKAWLFAIILRVASNQRRSLRRRGAAEPLGDRSIACAQPGPFDLTARAQAAQLLHTFLNSLDDNRRAVFIMSELEQLTAPEIAQALAANLNTVYSWLRAARVAFSKALQNVHAANGVEP